MRRRERVIRTLDFSVYGERPMSPQRVEGGRESHRKREAATGKCRVCHCNVRQSFWLRNDERCGICVLAEDDRITPEPCVQYKPRAK